MHTLEIVVVIELAADSSSSSTTSGSPADTAGPYATANVVDAPASTMANNGGADDSATRPSPAMITARARSETIITVLRR